MYAKIFEQIYDGTLCSRGPWQALVTFQQLLILADSHGCVDMTPTAISRRTTIPLDVIETGLKELVLPDPDSRTPDEAGRRIIPLSESRSWGWKIVNYLHYRNLRDEESRREYHRKYWHDRKVKKTQLNSTNSTESQPTQPMQYAVSSKKTTLSGDPDDVRVARDMFAAIQKINPKHKEPNFDKWADEIRLIRERDNRTHEEIVHLFQWANADSFWRSNILSPASLRKQWDKLSIKIKSTQTQKPHNPFDGAI